MSAETDAKHRALSCAADYAEEVARLKADLVALREVSGLDGKAMSILHDAREAHDRVRDALAAMTAERDTWEKHAMAAMRRARLAEDAQVARERECDTRIEGLEAERDHYRQTVAAVTSERDRLAGLLRVAAPMLIFPACGYLDITLDSMANLKQRINDALAELEKT